MDGISTGRRGRELDTSKTSEDWIWVRAKEFEESTCPTYIEHDIVGDRYKVLKKSWDPDAAGWVSPSLKCECGVESVGEGTHSEYCPRYCEE